MDTNNKIANLEDLTSPVIESVFANNLIVRHICEQLRFTDLKRLRLANKFFYACATEEMSKMCLIKSGRLNVDAEGNSKIPPIEQYEMETSSLRYFLELYKKCRDERLKEFMECFETTEVLPFGGIRVGGCFSELQRSWTQPFELESPVLDLFYHKFGSSIKFFELGTENWGEEGLYSFCRWFQRMPNLEELHINVKARIPIPGFSNPSNNTVNQQDEGIRTTVAGIQRSLKKIVLSGSNFNFSGIVWSSLTCLDLTKYSITAPNYAPTLTAENFPKLSKVIFGQGPDHGSEVMFAKIEPVFGKSGPPKMPLLAPITTAVLPWMDDYGIFGRFHTLKFVDIEFEYIDFERGLGRFSRFPRNVSSLPDTLESITLRNPEIIGMYGFDSFFTGIPQKEIQDAMKQGNAEVQLDAARPDSLLRFKHLKRLEIHLLYFAHMYGMDKARALWKNQPCDGAGQYLTRISYPIFQLLPNLRVTLVCPNGFKADPNGHGYRDISPNLIVEYD